MTNTITIPRAWLRKLLWLSDEVLTEGNDVNNGSLNKLITHIETAELFSSTEEV